MLIRFREGELAFAFVALLAAIVLYTRDIKNVKAIENEDPSANPRADWRWIALPLVASALSVAAFIVTIWPTLWPFIQYFLIRSGLM